MLWLSMQGLHNLRSHARLLRRGTGGSVREDDHQGT